MVKKILVPVFFAVLGCFLCVFVYLGTKVSKTGSLISEAVRKNDHDNLIKLEAPYYNSKYLKRDVESSFKYTVYEALNYEFQDEKDFKYKVNRKTNLHDSYYIVMSNFSFDPFQTNTTITDSSNKTYTYNSFFPSYFQTEFDFHKLPFVSLSIFTDELVDQGLSDISTIEFKKVGFDGKSQGTELIEFSNPLPFKTEFFDAVSAFRLKYNEYVAKQDIHGAKDEIQKYYDEVFFPNYKYSKADPSYFSSQAKTFPIIITTVVAILYVVIVGIILFFILFKPRKNKAQTLKKIVKGEDKNDEKQSSKPKKDLKKLTNDAYQEK